MDQMLNLLILPLAWLADCFLGDPRFLSHPVIWFGKTISKGEKWLNKEALRRWKGGFMAVLLISLTWLIFFLANKALKDLHPAWWMLFNVLFVFYGLANKTLIAEGKQVFNALQYKGLEAGRNQLSRIVGRNTSQLTDNQVKKSVLETMSENLSDGVVAPLFYYALGGVPAMMAYKMINTLDSMIGYKTTRYRDFGMVAARIDDVANLIPARITGILIALIGVSQRAFTFMLRYGKAHSSPNAGYPESALAGVLNCRFGGPMQYGDYYSPKPFIGENERALSMSDFRVTARINHGVCAASIIIITLLQWIQL